MRLNIEKRVILHVLFFTTIILIIGVAVIWPTVLYIQTLNRETNNLASYLKKRYENTKRIHYSRQKAEEIKQETANFPALIFRAENQLNLITSLESIAAKDNVNQKINNFNLDKNSNQVTMSMETSGEYKNNLQYISDLERMNYFLNIRRLTFVPQLDRDGQYTSSTKLLLELDLYASN